MSIGIRFNDCLFSEPVAVAGWTPPRYAGLFVVLVNDSNWAPKALQPLYFGEFGNNAPLPTLALDYPRLLAAAKGRILLVAVLPMPFSTTAQRRELHNELVGAYNPECGFDGNMVQLANVNQSFQPPPEAPRRRIGFMPHTESAAG
jgi:hypothetical protein